MRSKVHTVSKPFGIFKNWTQHQDPKLAHDGFLSSFFLDSRRCLRHVGGFLPALYMGSINGVPIVHTQLGSERERERLFVENINGKKTLLCQRGTQQRIMVCLGR